MSYYRQGPYRPGGPTMGIAVPELTPVVKKIVVACVGVWFLQWVLHKVGSPLEPWLGLVPWRVVHGWIWQPLTAIFLHGGLMHLLFNMLVLWMFGGDLERYWGGRAFLRYYLVCGVGGALLATANGFAPWSGEFGPFITTIGASGAIFGLLVAFGMIFGERTVLFFMIFPMKARTMVLILCAIEVFTLLDQAGTVFLSGGRATPMQSSVSWISHVGGALFGYLYLKRAWRLREFYGELRWRLRRRKFRVMDDKDRFDRWVN